MIMYSLMKRMKGSFAVFACFRFRLEKRLSCCRAIRNIFSISLVLISGFRIISRVRLAVRKLTRNLFRKIGFIENAFLVILFFGNILSACFYYGNNEFNNEESWKVKVLLIIRMLIVKRFL